MAKYDVTINVEPGDVVAALKEINRELGVRKGVYPKWVKDGKLTQSLASERIHLMEVASRTLDHVVNSMSQPYQSKLDFGGAGAGEDKKA